MIIDSFFVHSAKMMQLLYGAVFYEGIGYTDTSDTGNIVIVRHELQYGTAHSSFFDAVFYGTTCWKLSPTSCSRASSSGLRKRRS